MVTIILHTCVYKFLYGVRLTPNRPLFLTSSNPFLITSDILYPTCTHGVRSSVHDVPTATLVNYACTLFIITQAGNVMKTTASSLVSTHQSQMI